MCNVQRTGQNAQCLVDCKSSNWLSLFIGPSADETYLWGSLLPSWNLGLIDSAKLALSYFPFGWAVWSSMRLLTCKHTQTHTCTHAHAQTNTYICTHAKHSHVQTHQTLVRNELRERILIRTDGGIRSGRDIMMGALLGADEYGECVYVSVCMCVFASA